MKVKGEKNGLCNRSACLTPEHVVFYNKGTHKYYCECCARSINQYNPRSSLPEPSRTSIYGIDPELCMTDDKKTTFEYVNAMYDKKYSSTHTQKEMEK